MAADEAVKQITNCKNSSFFYYFMSAQEVYVALL